MKVPANIDAMAAAYETARAALLAEQRPGGYWLGELSSSALATATAVSALSLAARDRFDLLISAGICWLQDHQNVDGGWGDTVDSPSNLSTTLLCQAAIEIGGGAGTFLETRRRAEDYFTRTAGKTPAERVRKLTESYGKDRTFAVPILANCALAGLVPWPTVPSLPFEMTALPRSWLRALNLHVVSYALPALIAVGRVIHGKNPTHNPFLWALRALLSGSRLKLLQSIQPRSGGYLEAVPLTSFVVMSLAATGQAAHPVVREGVEFLEKNARSDGSWPIDTNLSTWVTTQAVAAFSAGGRKLEWPSTMAWLLDQQCREVHPYTASPPGGWGWSPLSGAVPDADDTSGALIALRLLDGSAPRQAVFAGVRWLLDLQNSDGGWPTFCRGWGKLPFDRSGADLTAHAMRALAAWPEAVDAGLQTEAVHRGIYYLCRSQRADGAWTPLWFGNQSAPNMENPVYGTARVLAALAELGMLDSPEARRGVEFLVKVQNADGGWGGDLGVSSTTEETALAVQSLVVCARDEYLWERCVRGCDYLARRVTEGALSQPAPIGLYFAKLWYSEALYPMIWTVGALGAVLTALEPKETGGDTTTPFAEQSADR
jgi:squalene-hopene/tetraprenyl-beta-curcumene cyclase